MVLATLSILAILGSSLLYAYVGYITSRRRVEESSRLGVLLFTTWWYGIAIASGAAAVTTLLARLDPDNAAAALALISFLVAVVVVAVWALVGYLAFLFTGSRRLVAALGAGYAALYAATLYVTATRQPVGFSSRGFEAEVAYAVPPGVSYSVVIALLLGPVVVAALLYGSLFFRLSDRTQRYRVGLVASSFFVWFGATMLATWVGVAESPWWDFVGRLLGLLAAIAVLAAYRPPRAVQRRYAIRPVLPAREDDGAPRGGPLG